jgi:hypothetical protein
MLLSWKAIVLLDGDTVAGSSIHEGIASTHSDRRISSKEENPQ